MKYLYCDSCFLITMYQEKLLDAMSQYKDQFFVSDTQIKGELIKPNDLAKKVREVVTVLEKESEEIIKKTIELSLTNTGLSNYDCLCMSYCLIDGYCLVTNDKALIKKCNTYNIKVKTAEDIKKEFNF